MSGYGQEEDIHRSHDAGFAAHLTKPASREALMEAVASVTDGGGPGRTPASLWSVDLIAPAGLAPVERRIDNYRLASDHSSPFFRTFRRPARQAGRRKVRKNGETGAGAAVFLVANPSLHRGKPGGGGRTFGQYLTKSTDRKRAGVQVSIPLNSYDFRKSLRPLIRAPAPTASAPAAPPNRRTRRP